ncbi:hypothetical protein MSIMFB_03496 [Mycobacterium simulans]|uniref:Uncharacterized protein n=1 Tax=Mycobacterium simulans TaxID=627089 RepID=A0A7Z7ILX6_9MYCO|nr:hypothetical protein MSIMFB_03496 [Mycobacterium simulans]
MSYEPRRQQTHAARASLDKRRRLPGLPVASAHCVAERHPSVGRVKRRRVVGWAATGKPGTEDASATTIVNPKPKASGLLPPSPASPGSGCPQLHPAAATTGRRRSLTSIRLQTPRGAHGLRPSHRQQTTSPHHLLLTGSNYSPFEPEATRLRPNGPVLAWHNIPVALQVTHDRTGATVSPEGINRSWWAIVLTGRRLTKSASPMTIHKHGQRLQPIHSH